MPRFKDITGQRFGRLVALRPNGKANDGATRWLCQCDCGASHTIRIDHLRNGKTRSCGCLSIRHGHTVIGKRHPLYSTWCGMLARCGNPNHRQYKDYGGRGIKVCERWQHDFTAFLFDVGERPLGRVLERIDNNGDYEPNNVCWATRKESAANKRSRKRIDQFTTIELEIELARRQKSDQPEFFNCSRNLDIRNQHP